MSITSLRDRLMRPALLFQPGAEKKAPREPSSLFGRVTHQAPHESWPEHNGVALCPLLQLTLTELPFKPENLSEVAFLTLFVHPTRYPDQDENETTWCLRTYRTTRNLVPCHPPPLDWPVADVTLDHPVLVEDYPCFEDLGEEVEDETWALFSERFPTRDGIKVGGWPRLLKSEIYWAPFNQHPARPEFAFQVDSLPEAGWTWGDAGCAYLGRGTAPGFKKTWTLEWQCL